MKKTTLLIFTIFCLNLIAQTNTTGLIELSTDAGVEYSAQLDVTDTQVTLTMVGPDDRWLGLGFDAASMTSGKDVVIFDGTTLTDRSFIGIGATPDDNENQDWTVSSNTTSSGVRTLVATRARDTGDSNDYVFSTTGTSINLVWARGSAADGFSLNYHGFGNKGITTEGFTLSQDDFKLSEFSISPNPSKDKLNIKLPSTNDNMKLEVFDVLGKRVYKGLVTQLESSVNVASWKSGVYLVRISNDKVSQTKRFIKQ